MNRIVKKETIDNIIEREQRTMTYIKARYESHGFYNKGIAHIETKNKKYMLIRYDKNDYKLLKSYDLKKEPHELKHISPRNRHNYRYNKR